MLLFKAIWHVMTGRERWRKLVVPVLFLTLEILLLSLFIWNMIGDNRKETAQSPAHVSVSRGYFTPQPHILVKNIHHEAYFVQDERPAMIVRNKNVHTAHYFFQALSLFVALIGLTMALLWIYRFYRKNSLNIFWWLWPTACGAAHILFFYFACHF